MKLTCIIIDDEPLARQGLELLIKEIDFLDLKGQFSNAIKANNFLSEEAVDLIFLDIQMPGLTGLEFAASLKSDSFIVFTTAYPQYALEGFELNALDYLVKPIRPNRFLQTINKAKELFDIYQKSEVSETTISNEFIYVKSSRTYVRIFLKDILYIQGMKDYVMLFTKTDKVMTAMNVKTIYDQLPQDVFARISKSHIINVNYIDQVEQECIQIADNTLPLGKSYKEAFITKFIKGNLIKRK